ncbi:MAG: RND transporter [Candidatus Hydrogenedentota bacterium]|nr:MAG: RND transporter [Candidatus Hydrogenedentota bacterium]PCJ61395.1 MAG: RND transporter [Candidatus Hydrogenedentota bacterium]
MNESLYINYAGMLIRFRWFALALSVGIFALCMGGAPYIQLDDNYKIFFDKDNPHLLALDQLEETYAKEEVILYVIAPENGDVFTRENLAAIQQLTEDAWQIPYCTRVDSITNFQHTYAEGDDIIVVDLVEDPAALSDENLASIKKIATQDPIISGRLISPSGHVTAVAVTLVLPGLEGGERALPIASAREIQAGFETAHPDLPVRLSGGAVLSIMFSEYTLQDMAKLTPIMYLLVFTAIALALRSFVATFIAIVTIIFSIGAALGLSGWFDLHMTAVSSTMPTVVMTLAVADCIHVLAILLQEMRGGKSKSEAMAESIRVNAVPVFVTSLTTCIGLLSLNFSSVPPLRDFGNMTAMGVVCAWLFSFLLLPALVAILPLRVKPRPAESRPMLGFFADWIIRYQKPVLVVSVLIGLGLTAFVPRNEFKNNWVNWFHEDTTFRQDLEFVTENLSGINAFEFSVPASGTSGVSDPEYLAALDAFAQWVRTQPYVDHVDTLADIIKKLNMNMHGDDPDYYTLPETQEMAAQFLLLYEMSLPYGMDLNNKINVDKSATRVMVISEHVDSTTVNEMKHAMEDWFVDNAPAYMQTKGTGNGVMFASIAETTIKSMVTSVPTALLLISITLVVVFRSFRYGLISLIPNLFPVLSALGVWGLMVGRVNFGVACVAGMSIGIIVDDTVHFLMKYLRGRRELGYDAEEAVRYAFETVGAALVITSLVLMVGFLVMTLSVFQFNANMGMLTVLAIGFAILTDLFMLPAVLLQFDRGKPTKDL